MAIPETSYFAALAIIGVVLALGFYTPVYWLLYILPVYKSFKWPARHLIITNFALCALAGYTAAILKDKWLLLVILLTVVELFLYGRRFLYLRRESDFYPPREVVEYLKKNKGTILTLSVLRDGVEWEPGILEFTANATIPLEIVNVTGYDPMIPRSYHQLTNVLQGLPKNEFGQVTIKLKHITKDFLDWLGVEYIYADREFEGFETIVKTKNGMLLRRVKCS